MEAKLPFDVARDGARIPSADATVAISTTARDVRVDAAAVDSTSLIEQDPRHLEIATKPGFFFHSLFDYREAVGSRSDTVPFKFPLWQIVEATNRR